GVAKPNEHTTCHRGHTDVDLALGRNGWRARLDISGEIDRARMPVGPGDGAVRSHADDRLLAGEEVDALARASMVDNGAAGERAAVRHGGRQVHREPGDACAIG